MKRFFIFTLFIFGLTISPLKAERVCIDIPDTWRANIEDVIVDLDTWVLDAIQGKNNKAKSGILKKEIKRSIDDTETLPAGEDAIIEKHLTRADYKNRAERNAEEEANRTRGP